jgi:phosphonate transport system substrate-binding protein
MRVARIFEALVMSLVLATFARGGEPLRFGVVSFYNPHLMYLKYQPLMDYLSQQTGMQWELAISPTYDEAVQDLCAGRTAVAYLGPVTYVRAHELCGAVPVVRLQTRGAPSYRSVILVRQDNPIRSLKELAGSRFGFGAPLSTSSHLLPRLMLLEAGLVPGRDVECRYYWHHERAAKAVVSGEVQACGVRDLAGEKFLRSGLRVLAQSEPIPNFPIALGPKSPPGTQESIVRALVTVPAQDRSVQALMASWDEELAGGFAVSTDAEFSGIRAMAARLFGPLWITTPEEGLRCGGGDR